MVFFDKDILEKRLRALTSLKTSIAETMVLIMDLNYCAADAVNSILAACIAEKNNPNGLVRYFLNPKYLLFFNIFLRFL